LDFGGPACSSPPSKILYSGQAERLLLAKASESIRAKPAYRTGRFPAACGVGLNHQLRYLAACGKVIH